MQMLAFFRLRIPFAFLAHTKDPKFYLFSFISGLVTTKTAKLLRFVSVKRKYSSEYFGQNTLTVLTYCKWIFCKWK